jgi:hypothetical protein
MGNLFAPPGEGGLVVVKDVAGRHKRPMADRQGDLWKGIQNARTWILPKVKVAGEEKAKESTWEKGFQSFEEKKKEM